jgi:hypothetical protein
VVRGTRYPVEAVGHAQAARNWDLAARLLSDQWVGLGLAGFGGTAHELLARFPPGVIAADAELAARVAGDQLARGSLEEAERYLALSSRALESVPVSRRGRSQVVLAVARMRLARQRGDLTAVAEETEQLLVPGATADLEETRPGGDLRALALVNLGIAEAWTARFDQADRHLADGIALARQIGRPYLEVTGLAHWAQLVSWRSFPLGAQHSLQALGRRGETKRVEQALAGMSRGERERAETRIAEASLRLAQDDPEAAAAVLAPVVDGSVPLRNAHLWEVQAFLLQAVSCDAVGDAGAARRALERALDCAEPESLLFPFLYDPAPDLLDRHRRHGTAHARLIAEILNVLAGRQPGSQPSGPQRLREPLSHAEGASCATCPPSSRRQRSPTSFTCR